MTFFARAVLLAALATVAARLPAHAAETDVQAPGVRYALLGPALSYHQQRTHANRPYNERHVGFGIERRSPWNPGSGWELALGVSAMQDSFRAPAFFATGALTHALASGYGFELRGGGIVGAAVKYTRWEGPHQLVPIVGPALALRHSPSGVGLGLNYQYKTNRTTGRVSGIFTLQSSYEF